jgi:hypothetical protein
MIMILEDITVEDEEEIISKKDKLYKAKNNAASPCVNSAKISIS